MTCGPRHASRFHERRVHPRSVRDSADDEIVVGEGDDDDDGHGERARGRACENNVVNACPSFYVDNDNNGKDTSTTTAVKSSYANVSPTWIIVVYDVACY